MSKNNTACIFNIQRFSIHDGPGIRTTVFFKGCPLRCAWCANPESQRLKPEFMWKNLPDKQCISGKFMTVESVMQEILKDYDYYEESGGGVTLSGGEVLYQSSTAISLLKKCKDYNIHTACETSGHADSNLFTQFTEHVDLVIFDVKHYDRLKHKEYTGVYPDKIFYNLEYLSRSSKNFLIRIPVIPDFNDSPDDASSFCELLHKYNLSCVELLPFHQLGKIKYSALHRKYKYANYHSLSDSELDRFKKFLVDGGIECI